MRTVERHRGTWDRDMWGQKGRYRGKEIERDVRTMERHRATGDIEIYKDRGTYIEVKEIERCEDRGQTCIRDAEGFGDRRTNIELQEAEREMWGQRDRHRATGDREMWGQRDRHRATGDREMWGRRKSFTSPQRQNSALRLIYCVGIIVVWIFFSSCTLFICLFSFYLLPPFFPPPNLPFATGFTSQYRVHPEKHSAE